MMMMMMNSKNSNKNQLFYVKNIKQLLFGKNIWKNYMEISMINSGSLFVFGFDFTS